MPDRACHRRGKSGRSTSLLAFDTRGVAVEHQHLLSEAETEVVRHYEMPRRGGSLGGQLRKAEEGLLERGVLLSHEGSTLSLLVEPEKGFRLRASLLDTIPEEHREASPPPPLG